ncbi:MAG: hypothetical protein K2I43_00960, partial [Alistipes sp.]|nr:hypothetical protein [Alistipes sp.]
IASKYRENERNVPLKIFLDDLELPITAVTFKIYNHLIVGAIIHVEPYELLVRTPIKKRIGFTLVFSPHYLLAAPYEEKIPELANRDKTKLEYVLVKWSDEYTKEIENLKYEYILYSK